MESELLLIVEQLLNPFLNSSKKKNLSKTCQKNGIRYQWAGKELGGKSNSENLKQILNGPNGKKYLQGVLGGCIKPICLMCKESDYRQCHRCDISDAVVRYNLAEIRHIKIENFRSCIVIHEVFKPQVNETELIETEEDKKLAQNSGLKMAGCWTHHMCASSKKERVDEFARRLNLVGFCVTGWPGIMVIEGFAENVDEFCQTIADDAWREFRVKIDKPIKRCTYEAWHFFDQDPNNIRHETENSFGNPELIMDCLKASNYDHLYDTLCFRKDKQNDKIFGHRFANQHQNTRKKRYDETNI